MATQSPDPQQGLSAHKTVSFYGNDIIIVNLYAMKSCTCSECSLSYSGHT